MLPFTRNDYLIGLATLISFVLSVSLWFSGQKDSGAFRRYLGPVDPELWRLRQNLSAGTVK